MSSKIAYKKWITAIGLALIAVLFIRVFVASPFVIPSQSMENTLHTGDYILVSKWQHGARITKYPIHWSHKSGETSFSDLIDLGYTRTPALSSIKHNDLIAFSYPIDKRASIDHNTTMLKRVVGMPGDSLQIINGDVYRNNKLQGNALTVKHYYVLIASQKEIKESFPKNSNPQRIAENSWKLELTANDATILRNHSSVVTLEQALENVAHYNPDVYPSDDVLGWNTHHIGPFIVPKKGLNLSLNHHNYKLYKTLIRNYEKQQIELRDETVYINNKAVESYTFHSDYYWMLGDNRDNSLDSRFWGFVPESHIVGKVTAVLFSWDQSDNSLRWDRSFSFIEKDGSLKSFRWVIYSLIAIFIAIKMIRKYVNT